MALSDEEKATLEALQAKASEPDEEDFDIEIWDDTGAGAKVPYRKGKTWLQRFGIDLPEQPAADQGDPGKEPGKRQPKQAATPEGTAQRYFGGKGKAS